MTLITMKSSFNQKPFFFDFPLIGKRIVVCKYVMCMGNSNEIIFSWCEVKHLKE